MGRKGFASLEIVALCEKGKVLQAQGNDGIRDAICNPRCFFTSEEVAAAMEKLYNSVAVRKTPK